MLPPLHEIEAECKSIALMPHRDMALLWRFAPVGHKYFDSSLPYHAEFMARFNSLGGMTSSVSKAIGLKKPVDYHCPGC